MRSGRALGGGKGEGEWVRGSGSEGEGDRMRTIYMQREEPGTEKGVYMVVSPRAFSCSHQCTHWIARVPPADSLLTCVNFSAILFMAPVSLVAVALTLCVIREPTRRPGSVFPADSVLGGLPSQGCLHLMSALLPCVQVGEVKGKNSSWGLLHLELMQTNIHSSWEKQLSTVPNQYFSLSKVVDLFIAGLGTCPNPVPHSLCLKVGRKPSSKVSTRLLLCTLASGTDLSWLELPFLL